MYKLDNEEVTRALRLFYQPGDCFEVRVLGAVTSSHRWSHVEAGYFTYESIDKVPLELAKYGKYKGVYVTANPCLPELLARRCNKIDFAEKDPITKDTEIVRRRWLLIDFDAVRPTGIASNNEQHHQAYERAKSIKQNLSDLGWPEPIFTDSGNGAQMMYRIDIPAGEEEEVLIKRILHSLALSNDNVIDVDVSVCNAARIWRLPGTWNCKGDSIETNPHRMARIFSCPDELQEVTMEQLQYVADMTPQEAPATAPPGTYAHHAGEFDIEGWMRKYFPDAKGPRPYNGGYKWVLKVCPFDSSHTDNSACVTVAANGQIGFVCHHNGCAGRGWKELREKMEPGCYDVKDKPIVSPEEMGIDLSGILKVSVHDEEEVTFDNIDEGKDYLDFPEELYDVPGIINEVKDLTLQYAPVPNRPLALCGAMSLMSYLCARKIKTPSGLRSNLYLLALAPSGCGKERPRDINQMILQALQWDDGLLDNVASGEALEEALKINPALLWQCDEFYSTLHSMSTDFGDNRNTIMKYLLQLYTSAHKKFKTRAKVGFPSMDIIDPHLSLFATTTPNGFFEHVNDRFLMDGMFARLSIFVAEKPSRGRLVDEPVIPQSLLQKIKAWKDWQPMGSGNIDTAIATAPYTKAGREAAIALREFQNDEYEKEMNSGEPCEWKLAVKNRLTENALRFALIHACSKAETPSEVSIDSSSIAWASRLVQFETENKIRMTERRYFRSIFEKYTESVISSVRSWQESKRQPMPGWAFSRKMKYIDTKTLNQVIVSLENQKRIRVIPNERGGGVKYSLPEFEKNE